MTYLTTQVAEVEVSVIVSQTAKSATAHQLKDKNFESGGANNQILSHQLQQTKNSQYFTPEKGLEVVKLLFNTVAVEAV